MTRPVLHGLGLAVWVLAGCHVVGGIDDATFEPPGGGGSAATTSSSTDTSSSTGGASSSSGSGGASSSSSGGGGAGGGGYCGHPSHGPTGPCPGDCDSCEGGTCVITCDDGANDCSSKFGNAITCPPGWDCAVACQGTDACHWASAITVNCPEGHRCEVDCAGNNACHDLNVACAPDGPCELVCAVTSGGCRDAELLCAEDDCVLSCIGSAPPGQMPNAPACPSPGVGCVCDDPGC